MNLLGHAIRSDDLDQYKVWFKMPSEDFKERKLLCIEDPDGIKQMVEAGRWSVQVNLYVVNLSEYLEDVMRDDDEDCEYEARSKRNGEFTDEDEADFDFHNTPPNSDSEEEEMDVVRCKRWSGVLKLRHVFDSLEEFKEGLVDYVLKERYKIMLYRWGRENSGAKCTLDGCKWDIFCSCEELVKKWMLKRYDDVHTCEWDGYSKMIKVGVLAKIFLPNIRTDPDLKPKAMQNQFFQRFGIMTTNDKCRKAKARALKIIQKEHKEQFESLKDYQSELIR